MINTNNVKNIIFDLGNVLLDVDFQQAINAFKNFNFDDFETQTKKLFASGIFEEFEKGKITPENFKNQLSSFFNKQISDEDFTLAWNSMLLDFPNPRIEFLKKLKNNYRLFLLSNTNIIHYNNFIQQSYWHSDLFEKEYYSHFLGMRKPDKKIFQIVLEENKLNPTETLFIDDMKQNIDAANELGIKTLHIEKPKTIEFFFNKFELIN